MKNKTSYILVGVILAVGILSFCNGKKQRDQRTDTHNDTNCEMLKNKDTVTLLGPTREVEEVYEVVDQLPFFLHGKEALKEWLRNNVKFPVVAQGKFFKEYTIVSFVVERDGSITDVKVVRSVDPSFDKEAIRVIKTMPRWVPGRLDGKTVRVRNYLPLALELQ